MASIATGAATNVSSEIAKGIFQEAVRHVRCVINCKKNVEEFEGKMEELIAKRRGVQQEVDAAKTKLWDIKADVDLWCNQVDEAIAGKLKKEEDLADKAKAKCFFGVCPANIKNRYQLSRKAVDNIKAVNDFLGRSHFNEVAVPSVPKALISAAPEDLKDFDTRKKVFEEIMEALKDSTISMIGVYGTGGVGKTTLVNQVFGQVKGDKSFGSVVKAAVTRSANIEKIQDQIAESLSLTLQERSKESRANRLFERLKNEPKILVILDDIWERLDLKEVGVPFGEQHKGCKVLLTSRDRNVLTNEMGAKKTIPINVLEEEEAWDLFKKMVGNDLENPELSELRSVATDVAKWCAGLPLAIVTVARALRDKDLYAWKDASQQLQTPSPSNFTGTPAAVYSAIQLSYDCLESKGLKQTFLLGCLLGNNAHIQDLLRCAMGLRLFDGLNTVEKNRNRLLTMVSKLKDSCLLLDGSNGDCFAMHDFVCDVALAIASRDNFAFALKRGDVFDDWVDEQRMKEFKWISLNFANTNKLPDELDCPQVILFSMATSSDKDSYAEMPPSFFRSMEKIQVLDLMKMDFSSSPSPISLPTSLRTLHLKKCVLGDLVNLGKLENLEILSISGSDIEMLPEVIGQLAKLRLLDLSYCTQLITIPPGVLSSLSRLEELYMTGIIVPWNQPSNARLDELNNKKLTALDIHILEAEIVPKDLFSGKLQRFKILIGGKDWDRLDNVEHSRTLKLRVNTCIDHLDNGFKRLLKEAEALYLENLEGVKIVLKQVGNWDCFLHLNHLHIRNAAQIQYIMKDDDDDTIEFRRLRSLTLYNLPQLISFCCKDGTAEGSTSLPQHQLPLLGEQMKFPCLEELCLTSINVETIWHSQFSALENLTSLVIEGCGNLKYIFSSSMATSLVHLRSLEIVECKSLTEIILTEDMEEENQVTLSFPQLNILEMNDLPHLIGYCSENYSIAFPSLLELDIMQCPKFNGIVYKSTTEENQTISMQGVFNKKVACPNLEWLMVKGCHNLQCLFSSSMMPLLTQLRFVWIEHCENIEVVFIEEEEEEEGAAEEDIVSHILPKLFSLEISDLPELMSFCHGSYLEFPSLSMLDISDCPKFKSFISDSTVANETQSSDTGFPPLFNKKVAFPQLEELELEGLRNCRKIWHDQLVGDSFSKLKQLTVSECHKLANVFPFNMTKRLRNLEEFCVSVCDSLEEIFEPQVLNAHELHGVTAIQSTEETTINFAFPNLTDLNLSNLPRLKSFYHRKHTTEWQSLNKIRVFACDMEEIFASDTLSIGEIENQQSLFWVNEVTFPNLEELKLECNDVLRKIWHGQLGADVLSVRRVFENLTALEVSKCRGSVNLMAWSTAKSLLQLKSMSVTDCDVIEEIIAAEGDELNRDGDGDGDGIVFTNLKYLQLNCLPSLASFCLGKHNFEFPALENVSVIRCPEMRIFSNGDLNTPMLRRVQFSGSEDDEFWEGDLNTTIQRLFTEKVGYHGLERLRLSDSSGLMEIWRMNLQVTLDFERLRYLEVYNCSTMRFIFTISMASDLPLLDELKIKNCVVLEHIIYDEEANEEVENKIVIPRLRFIILESCGDLASFYRGSQILECPSLRAVHVLDCPQMFAFASTSRFSREQSIIETVDDGGNTIRHSKGARDVPFFNNRVALKNLTYLKVSGCHGFVNLIACSTAESLGNFKRMIITDCDMIEEIIGDDGDGEEVEGDIVFTELEYLRLSCLPSLSSFCLRDHGFEFPALEIMVVRECPKMEIFCQGDIGTPRLQKVLLTEEYLKGQQPPILTNDLPGRWEGNLKTTIKQLFEEMNAQNSEEI